MRRMGAGVAALLAVIAAPAAADAFCGFYVSGAGADLFNNATQVVMMRSGTRTVLSMQNNYQGPPENFAMVVPVPVVLQQENVKTLPREIFKRVDELDAPRLVEYWEEDPCYKPPPPGRVYEGAPPPVEAPTATSAPRDLGVKIEAKFTVGEYQIVILSAKDSTGLDTWLRQEKYKIPDGAGPYLKPYVEAGSKFFVAKVDITKVAMEKGRAMLSPLRFHYDTGEFTLPIRLGLMNSAGTQDLIVHILAPGQRYEAANYPNVTVPTNLDVVEEARGRFGEFYAALFDRTIERHPKAVVTEYAWSAGSCDPCPTPALDPSDVQTLGGDVLGAQVDVYSMVLTRLHTRYGKDAIGEDLVFRAVPPIQGGREERDEKNQLEVGAKPAGDNNFQARYAVRHPWAGPIDCSDPVRGRWGGPPENQQQIASGPVAATELAFAPRGKIELTKMVLQDVPELAVPAGGKRPAGWVDPRASSKKGCCGIAGSDAWMDTLLVIAAMWLGLMRRRRCAGR